MPGMVRVSFGCYNTIDDVDKLVEVLERIATGEYAGQYVVDHKSGDYYPKNFKEPLDKTIELMIQGAASGHVSTHGYKR